MSDTLIHTSLCVAARNLYLREYNAFRAAHPNRCDSCDGRGGESYRYDPSPAGVGLGCGWFWEFDPCQDCLGAGKCPWCGSQIDAEADDPKCSCGWSEKSARYPEAHECMCWEERECRQTEAQP